MEAGLPEEMRDVSLDIQPVEATEAGRPQEGALIDAKERFLARRREILPPMSSHELAAFQRSTEVSNFYDLDTQDQRTLVLRAQRGDMETFSHILALNRGFIRFKARAYFIAGGSPEDVIEAGFIGAYKGIRDYDPERDSGVRNFLELCISREIITAVKTSTRGKHRPLNEYVSYDRATDSGLEEADGPAMIDALGDLHRDETVDPLLEQEETRQTLEILNAAALTELESGAFAGRLNGETYEETGQRMGVTQKAVDNALRRATEKLLATREKVLAESEAISPMVDPAEVGPRTRPAQPKLSAVERKVLFLRYYGKTTDGKWMPPRQIAGILRLEVDEVREALHCGLLKVRKTTKVPPDKHARKENSRYEPLEVRTEKEPKLRRLVDSALQDPILTEFQRGVLACRAQGMSAPEGAKVLGTTYHSFRETTYHVKRKLARIKKYQPLAEALTKPYQRRTAPAEQVSLEA